MSPFGIGWIDWMRWLFKNAMRRLFDCDGRRGGTTTIRPTWWFVSSIGITSLLLVASFIGGCRGCCRTTRTGFSSAASVISFIWAISVRRWLCIRSGWRGPVIVRPCRCITHRLASFWAWRVISVAHYSSLVEMPTTNATGLLWFFLVELHWSTLFFYLLLSWRHTQTTPSKPCKEWSE